MLLTFDDSYARTQILNKEEQMEKFFKGYVLKKTKLLFKKVGWGFKLMKRDKYAAYIWGGTDGMYVEEIENK